MVTGMGHSLRMFVGPKAALRPFVTLVPAARVYALTPGAAVLALPLTEAVHEALHARYGTGEWIDFATGESHPRLTSSDMEFAARASAGSALAWLMVDGDGADGEQAASVWINGAVQLKPALLRTNERRALSLRPVNMALRLLGVKALGPGPGEDEFAAFGLPRFRNVEEISERGLPVRV